MAKWISARGMAYTVLPPASESRYRGSIVKSRSSSLKPLTKLAPIRGLRAAIFPSTSKSSDRPMAPVIFIVNANAALRLTVDSVVRAEGWHAQIFEDANAYFAQSHSPMLSCLVVDMGLLADRGHDLKTLSEVRPETPVIATAKGPTLRAAVLAMKAGAMEFFPEPLDAVLLVSAIRAALDRSREALCPPGRSTRTVCSLLRSEQARAGSHGGRRRGPHEQADCV